VQHFLIAHINDLEERVNQLMVARHAHTQLSHTHAPHQSCSFCYHPSHQIDDCPFINHYMIGASNSHHECSQTTTFGSEEVVEVIFCEPSLEDPLGERFDQFGGDLNLDKLLDHADTFIEPSLEDPSGERFDQFGGDLDLDKLFDHADTFSEPILEDPSGEHFDQIECNLDLDKFLKQAMMFREPSLEDPLDESFA
jgi:Zn-finger protein